MFQNITYTTKTINNSLIELKDIGVYKIVNKIINQIYIGSTSGKYGFCQRFQTHIRELKNNKHNNSKLQNSWNKYGENSFYFEILENCIKKNTIKLEQKYIDSLNPFFNINKKADSRLGMFHTDETKLKISKTKKSQNLSLTYSHKIAISKKLKGRKRSPESIEKTRLANLGKKRGSPSEETKNKKGKTIVILNFYSNEILYFKTMRSCANYFNIFRQEITSSIKLKIMFNGYNIAIYEKDFDSNKNKFDYFKHYKYKNENFLTLKEIGQKYNFSETNAFRRMKKGEIKRYAPGNPILY